MTTTLPAAVRGECPGVHTPFLEADGALLRVRVPGGALTAGQLRTAANSGGTLEITSRANLQIRGLDPAGVPAIAATLVDAGLALPDPDRDERRNVLASPTAGFDPAELVDTRALVADIATLLSAGSVVRRSPKFGVLVDGGGVISVRGRKLDVCLGAIRIPAGDGPAGAGPGGGGRGSGVPERSAPRYGDPDRGVAPRGAVLTGPAAGTGDCRCSAEAPAGCAVAFEVRLDEMLPSAGATPSGPAVLVAVPQALAAVEAALAMCPPDGRTGDVVAAAGRAATLARLAAACGGVVADVWPPAAAAPTTGLPPGAGTAVGVHAGAPAEGIGAPRWCGAAPLLGRLTPASARGLADLAADLGNGEVRLTPWRGVIVPGLEPAAVPALIAGLERLGLSADPADPCHRVVACAGSAGCHSGLTDTQADGARLVALLRTVAPSVGPGGVHLSGCPKGCAGGAPAEVTLVGGPGAGTYELYRRDPAAGGFGRREATGLDPEKALAAIVNH